MLWKGFKFGMLLQLAVGPVCLLIFTLAAGRGWLAGELAAVAAAFVDAAYIAASVAGIAILLQRPGAQRWLKLGGGIVLIVFGLSLLWGAWQEQVLSVGTSGNGYRDFFFAGLFLTAANPLTIVFWGGVFAGQAVQEELSTVQLRWFAVGCVAATLVFLSTIAAVGSLAGQFLPLVMMRILNGAVGVAMLWFGVRMQRA